MNSDNEYTSIRCLCDRPINRFKRKNTRNETLKIFNYIESNKRKYFIRQLNMAVIRSFNVSNKI